MSLTVGSLFSGIGGLDLGLERAGMEIRWQCEINPFCREVLQQHWPNVRLYHDVREIENSKLERVDVLAGGFPCQDISSALRADQRRDGIEGERSGLFFELMRIASDIRPRYIIMENVPNLINEGLETVLAEVASIGYDAEWEIIQANWFGLPHVRKRIIIVAYPSRLGRGVFDQIDAGILQDVESRIDNPNYLPSCSQRDTKGVMAAYLRNDDGVSDGVDRLTSLGNAVVPQVAQFVGELIIKAEAEA